MDTGGAFALGVLLLILWVVVIVLFSRPNLFRDLLNDYMCCSQKDTASENNINKLSNGNYNLPQQPHPIHHDYYPTLYTVPSSQSSSTRRSRRSHSQRSTSKSPSRRSSQLQQQQNTTTINNNYLQQQPLGQAEYRAMYADDLAQQLAMEIAITSQHHQPQQPQPHPQTTMLAAPDHSIDNLKLAVQQHYDSMQLQKPHQQRVLVHMNSAERDVLIPLPEEDSDVEQSSGNSRRQSENDVLAHTTLTIDTAVKY